MEIEKVKEKAKRGNYQTKFGVLDAIKLICFTFFALSIMTSHRSIGAFPEPQFFSFGSFVLTMILIASPIIAFLDGLAKFSRLILWGIILAALGIICLPISYGAAFFGSWIVYAWVYQPLQNLPTIIFPLLALASLGLYRFSQSLEKTLSLHHIRLISFCITWIAALYIWGQTTMFDGDSYDESKFIEEKSYHLIIHYDGSDSPNYGNLYECQFGYFFCQQIYHSDSFYDGSLRADTSSLVYDESSRVLRLEYISQTTDTVSVLYEQSIP